MSLGSALNDGQWHSVELTYRRGRLTVAIDGDEEATAHASLLFPITTGDKLFFGGKKTNAYMHHHDCLESKTGIFVWLEGTLSLEVESRSN